MSVNLNFINQSNDQKLPQIVIFQKNFAGGSDETAIAWRVLGGVPAGGSQSLLFPSLLELSAACGDTPTEPVTARHGELFAVRRDPSSGALTLSTGRTDAGQIHLHNESEQGAIAANIYRDGRLLASQIIAERGKAAFQFKPTIWIGTVSGAVEGQPLDATALADVNTELSLLGLASADIVMTGGAAGEFNPPLRFSLQNIVMA